MSLETFKCVTNINGEGTTGKGRFVAKCIVEKLDNGLTDYKIVEPVSVKNRWSSSYYGFKVLPKNIAEKYPIGFYTSGSHYKINRDAGFTEHIKDKIYFERLIDKPDYDENRITWYSRGLQLRDKISDTQTHLYHM